MPRADSTRRQSTTLKSAAPTISEGSVIGDLEAGAEAIALVDLRDQPFMPRRHGKKLDRSVPFRWASCGVGGVKLETTKAGGILVTTKAATLRFFARLNGDTPTPAARTPKSRERNVARAERDLADMGLR